MKCQFISIVLLLFFYGCESAGNVEHMSGAEGNRPNILFLIADDWSYPHASILGDPVVRTPTFDAIARSGVLFHNAYCASPSCSPSRASILTGRYPHENGAAGNLWSEFTDAYPTYTHLLKEAGYHVGMTRKGWAPGEYLGNHFPNNPAGERYDHFEEFLEDLEDGQPFCFWFGSSDPHRIYETNTGANSGMKISDVKVPPVLPDVPCVRNDMLDYYFEVERFDRECGQLLHSLESRGLLENTLVVMTADNGMPFPRAKANVYDLGTRMPFAVQWPAVVQPEQTFSDYINFIDLAPTFLNASGVDIPSEMSGKSLLPILMSGMDTADRSQVFLERERHANVRKGDLSYPVRAVRNDSFLYIRNFEPDRWPAGDPSTYISVGQYGDVDNSISKFLILDRGEGDTYFDQAFGKRPAEELYDLVKDPDQLTNVVANQDYQEPLVYLRTLLQDWMIATDDRRVDDPQTLFWDTVRYTPTYQFSDYDLDQEIEAYEMLNPNVWPRKEWIGCK